MKYGTKIETNLAKIGEITFNRYLFSAIDLCYNQYIKYLSKFNAVTFERFLMNKNSV